MAATSSKGSKRTRNNRLFDRIFIPCRVKDIILDGSSRETALYGGYDAVGMIYYNEIKIKQTGLNTNPDALDRNDAPGFDGVAKPLFPFLKYYPLLNEVVLILSSTSKDYLDNRSARQNYYLPPLNLWNHPHHNSLPAVQNFKDSAGVIFKNEDYEQAGLLRRVISAADAEDIDIDIPLGKYFKEKLDIKPLLPYEGDHIVEGRFGNSIRFGSTSRPTGSTAIPSNYWSDGIKGDIGDPITIIRNGQSYGLEEGRGWVHTIENINLDPSSIYLTSNQKISNLAIATPSCWYSFGRNAVIPQNDNEEAKKFKDSPIDFLVGEGKQLERNSIQTQTSLESPGVLPPENQQDQILQNQRQKQQQNPLQNILDNNNTNVVDYNQEINQDSANQNQTISEFEAGFNENENIGTQINLNAGPGKLYYKNNPTKEYIGPYHIHPTTGPMVGNNLGDSQDQLVFAENLI